MNQEQILNKKNPSKLDKLTLFVLEQVSRLHDEKIEYEDMNQIHKDIACMWRKYHPLKDWDVGSQTTGSGNTGHSKIQNENKIHSKKQNDSDNTGGTNGN